MISDQRDQRDPEAVYREMRYLQEQMLKASGKKIPLRQCYDMFYANRG